ncbi:MAG: phospholipid carrier-dependent glycosyltransferase [Pirellulaceae bacterium]|nr:phospholipid carrier-dependent glycosyltransferase [Pirellulaceae bacterium]
MPVPECSAVSAGERDCSSVRTAEGGYPARVPLELALLLLFALVVRVGVLFLLPGALADDPDGYRALARNLVAHGTLGEGDRPTAYRPPLYPLALVPSVAVGEPRATWAIGALHVAMGLGTVALAWWIGRHCGLGRYAWVAGVLVACDPILLNQSALVMTETLAAMLVALALACLGRLAEQPGTLRAATAGAALGLCGLCRPELLLWAALCAAALWLYWHAMQEQSRARQEADAPAHSLTVGVRFGLFGARFWSTAAFVAAVAIVLLPWTIRNQIQFGRPIVATTHGGYTLLLANNPAFYDHLCKGEWGSIWDARELGPVWGGNARHADPVDELAADRRAYAEAWANIRREPGRFAYSCAMRVGRFWAPAPRQGSPALRWTVGVWYLAVFFLAAVGAWRGWRGDFNHGIWLWGGLLAVSMTLVHAVYWSDPRMRGPLMIVVGFAAATAIARWPGRPTKP